MKKRIKPKFSKKSSEDKLYNMLNWVIAKHYEENAYAFVTEERFLEIAKTAYEYNEWKRNEIGL